MSKLYYMASVYSIHPRGVEEAYKEACEQAAFLEANGIHVISPIAHSHGITGYVDPSSYGYDMMMKWDYNIIDHMDGIIVCKMDNWENSKGIGLEIKYCTDRSIPIFYMTPGEVPIDVKVFQNAA